MNDVVFILKKTIVSEELKYSLRSIEQNFPFARVWFFGGCPKDLKPDEFVSVFQNGCSKWERSTSTLRNICKSGVSNDFWLFNDDFFVLKPINHLPYMYKGTLAERVEELTDRYGIKSEYAKNLEKTGKILEKHGLMTLDYALHVPMLINKQKAKEVLDAFPGYPMFRSLYGNYCNVGGVKAEDVKIYEPDRLPTPEQVLLSTCDRSFNGGAVGEYVRNEFKNPSKWEK